MHWFWHLSRLAAYLNPRVGGCMIDKDFAGRVKRIVDSAANGNSPAKVPLYVMEKIIWTVHFNQQAQERTSAREV